MSDTDDNFTRQTRATFPPSQARIIERMAARLDALESARRETSLAAVTEQLERTERIQAEPVVIGTPSADEPIELARRLRDTTERMASLASVPMDMWGEHSNAALNAASFLADLEAVEPADREPAAPARLEADVVREVVEALRWATNEAREWHNETGHKLPNWHALAVAALAALDASPPADTAAVRDAALEEAAERLAAQAEHQIKIGETATASILRGATHTVLDLRALRTFPAPKAVTAWVTMEEIKSWFTKPLKRGVVTDENLACDFVENFAGRTITRKD